jgi:hypothetical protein
MYRHAHEPAWPYRGASSAASGWNRVGSRQFRSKRPTAQADAWPKSQARHSDSFSKANEKLTSLDSRMFSDARSHSRHCPRSGNIGRRACEPDVNRLCSELIPDRSKIILCLNRCGNWIHRAGASSCFTRSKSARAIAAAAARITWPQFNEWFSVRTRNCQMSHADAGRFKESLALLR